MRKGFSVLLLLAAIAAALVAIAVYLRRISCEDDDILELYEDEATDYGYDYADDIEEGMFEFSGSEDVIDFTPAPQETAGTDDEVSE